MTTLTAGLRDAHNALVAGHVESADHIDTDQDVHGWFELSYSNYLVLPRTLMQSMPVEWQHRMVTCLQEPDDAYAHIDRAPGYTVQACDWTYPIDLGAEGRARLGITCEYDGDPGNLNTEVHYHDRDGNELDAYTASVPVPVLEPIPHYNRGRTFIPPREAGGSHA